MGLLDTLTPATCGSCAYWHQRFEEVGTCQRHAPALVVKSDGNITETSWPLTATSETCGDWDRRQEALQP